MRPCGFFLARGPAVRGTDRQGKLFEQAMISPRARMCLEQGALTDYGWRHY